MAGLYLVANMRIKARPLPSNLMMSSANWLSRSWSTQSRNLPTRSSAVSTWGWLGLAPYTGVGAGSGFMAGLAAFFALAVGGLMLAALATLLVVFAGGAGRVGGVHCGDVGGMGIDGIWDRGEVGRGGKAAWELSTFQGEGRWGLRGVADTTGGGKARGRCDRGALGHPR